MGRWLALVSKHWPFINPDTIDDLDVRWWAYYVRAAQQIDDATRDASRQAQQLERKGPR